MIGMVDRLRVQVLREAGHSLQEIADLVGVSKRAVQMIVREPRITDSALGTTPRSRGVGRPSVVEGFRSAVAELLATEPALPSVEDRST